MSKGGKGGLMPVTKQYPTLGCCGLDCGLCPRFYTAGSSRCPGCFGEGFAEKHPSCSVITCCVKKKGLEVCAECDEFPCSKLELGDTDSFVTHKRIFPNHNYIREFGLERFIEQQNRRMDFLMTALDRYDDGRSKSFFCLAAALLSLESLTRALAQAEQEVKEKSVSEDDLRNKARIIKSIINELATEEDEELKLRKKQ